MILRSGWAGASLAWRLRTAWFAGIAVFVPFAAAQTAGVHPSGPAIEVHYPPRFAPDTLQFGHVRGYDTVTLPEAGFLSDAGRPQLPTQMIRIALPAGMRATDVHVVGTEATPLAGEYMVLPAQPPLRTTGLVAAASFVPPDPGIYAGGGLYPAQLVVLVGQSDLAGQAFAVLQVYPLLYLPAARKLQLHTAIDIVVTGVAGYTCGDYLPARVGPAGRATYRQMVQDLVVNPEDVALQTDANAGAALGVPPGEYAYVIITQSNWESAFQPLADWKTKKGVPAAIVTTSWIYDHGGYNGSNTDRIRAFIMDAHTVWGAEYFLLGGDTSVMPCPSRTFPVDPAPVPNDTAYGDYDGDWVCEVHIGRASIANAAGIAAFTDKVFTYEKNPPRTDYATTTGFFGFDLLSGGHEGEGLMTAIQSLYLPSSWTFRKAYDSDSGDHKLAVLGILNQGSHLVNHCDHAGSYYMGTGFVNHNSAVHSNDLAVLFNAGRQSVAYSLGCWACDYASAECVAEAFLRNASGGGVAFVGNSRYGWFLSNHTDLYSLRYDRYFYRSLFAQGHFTLGACFSDHKNDAYQNDDYHRYIFTELTLLGDPELPIWTEEPGDLAVTHPGTLIVGQPNSFAVQVFADGSPLTNATVCLWKFCDFYQVGQTDPSGTATFLVTPAAIGPVSVTVSLHNYIPYEGAAQTVDVPRLGDLNCNGAVDFADINPFVLAVTDPAAYHAAFPDCNLLRGDCDGNGTVDFDDVDPLVELLSR